MRSPRITLALLLIGSLAVGLVPLDATEAQVTTAITSSWPETTVMPPPSGSTVYQITGGRRAGPPEAPGPNLFHSFGQFSVGTGDIAKFTNTTPGIPTTNI